MTRLAGLPDGITKAQANALLVLHGQLGRTVPEIAGLSFDAAGDLIISLRGDLLDILATAPVVNDTIPAGSLRDPITADDLGNGGGCLLCAATFGQHNGPSGTCPDHGHEYAYAHDSAIHDEVGPGRTRHACPEPGCPRVKWYS